MSKKRQIYLLMMDGKVIKTKKSIRKIRALGLLSGAKWVLLPIYKTLYTYIAVDADTIIHLDFDRVIMRYHMKYKTVGRGEHNAPIEDTIFDYYTVESEITSIETFYNAIYNIMAFRYFKELYANSDGIDKYWFIDVPDIAISFYKGKKSYSKLCIRSEQAVDEVPFDYSPADEMSARIASNFGLLGHNDWINLNNLTMSYDKEGAIRWRFSREAIQVFTNVYKVGIANPFTKAFTLLKSRDYDASLAIETTSIFVTPMDLSGLDISFLPICHKYEIPLYQTDAPQGDIDSPSTLVFHDLSYRVYEVFSFESITGEEYAVFLDNLEYLLQIFTEGVRVHILEGADKDDEIAFSKLMTSATVLVTMELNIIAVDHPAEVLNLTINTDSYEDRKPTIKDVCKLIRLHDKPF